MNQDFQDFDEFKSNKNVGNYCNPNNPYCNNQPYNTPFINTSVDKCKTVTNKKLFYQVAKFPQKKIINIMFVNMYSQMTCLK